MTTSDSSDAAEGQTQAALPPYEVHWRAAGEGPAEAGPLTSHYPVRLADGSTLELPLRALPGGEAAIALLMSNQTPFAVEDVLAPLLTEAARAFQPEAIVAVPTMGLDYARLVARGLGFSGYTALGLSRKFWYDEALSECVTSSTSPGQAKRLYLDPGLLSRVRGKRVVLIDDVINTGASALAAIRLLQRAGAQVEGLVVALTEGQAWRSVLSDLGAPWPGNVRSAGHIPLFVRAETGGWLPSPVSG
jgi:adenine/guanine phosphoribosyltransferase-like PRPP-binding protein